VEKSKKKAGCKGRAFFGRNKVGDEFGQQQREKGRGNGGGGGTNGANFVLRRAASLNFRGRTNGWRGKVVKGKMLKSTSQPPPPEDN
jgi:hypothetical protein